jgi:hypothetical protein
MQMRNVMKNRSFGNIGVRGPVSLWLMQPHPGRLIIDTRESLHLICLVGLWLVQPHPGRLIIDTRREPAFNLPSGFVACAAILPTYLARSPCQFPRSPPLPSSLY